MTQTQPNSTSSDERRYTFTTPTGTEIGSLRWHNDAEVLEYARRVVASSLTPALVVRRLDPTGQVVVGKVDAASSSR